MQYLLEEEEYNLLKAKAKGNIYISEYHGYGNGETIYCTKKDVEHQLIKQIKWLDEIIKEKDQQVNELQNKLEKKKRFWLF